MTPGPDLALITRLVLNRATLRPAAAAAIGMITAGAVQAMLGAAGLAVLFSTRPGVFTAFRWAGATVLLGWAILALRSALRSSNGDLSTVSTHERVAEPHEHAGRSPAGLRPAFAQGLLCTGANPKVGFFLMAFLPQFVPRGMDPAAGMAILAACYLALGLIWLMVWIRLGGQAGPVHALRAGHVYRPWAHRRRFQHVRRSPSAWRLTLTPDA
jgi:threonine/homoserine/homoserine lactone efflux protein